VKYHIKLPNACETIEMKYSDYIYVMRGSLLIGALFLSAIAPLTSTVLGEKGFFNVTVHLNTSQNIRVYNLHVIVYGEEAIEQSRIVDTSSQICPDDIESQCYKSESFLFPNDGIPVGSEFKVCIEEPVSHIEKCAAGQNKSDNTPEVVSIEVPDIVTNT